MIRTQLSPCMAVWLLCSGAQSTWGMLPPVVTAIVVATPCSVRAATKLKCGTALGGKCCDAVVMNHRRNAWIVCTGCTNMLFCNLLSHSACAGCSSLALPWIVKDGYTIATTCSLRLPACTWHNVAVKLSESMGLANYGLLWVHSWALLWCCCVMMWCCWNLARSFLRFVWQILAMQIWNGPEKWSTLSLKQNSTSSLPDEAWFLPWTKKKITNTNKQKYSKQHTNTKQKQYLKNKCQQCELYSLSH